MSHEIFWDSFYSKRDRESFEWLVDHNELANLNTLDLTSRTQENLDLMLDVGCGTSTFSSELQLSCNQPSFLICVDFSHRALSILDQTLLKSNRRSALLDFVQCDGRNLPFRSQLFDLIIDKGYLDSVLKSEEKPTEYATKSIRSAVEKLEPSSGRLVQITDEPPELRMALLDEFASSNRLDLNTTFKQIDLEQRNSTYYMYLISKRKPF